MGEIFLNYKINVQFGIHGFCVLLVLLTFDLRAIHHNTMLHYYGLQVLKSVLGHAHACIRVYIMPIQPVFG